MLLFKGGLSSPEGWLELDRMLTEPSALGFRNVVAEWDDDLDFAQFGAMASWLRDSAQLHVKLEEVSDQAWIEEELYSELQGQELA
ncbi:hypothetical protein VTK73DRAFT_5514 [Phialemonium thermophilum]|uniref:Uncharacterized protein n=1 Tax=Phialemonium thermophilum TaxID=223376 RepID=A0ABR3V1D0_9PEZI